MREEVNEKKGASVDGITRHVLGIDAFMKKVTPRSEAARTVWKNFATNRFLDPASRRRRIERWRRLDRRATQDRIALLDEDLRALPTLERLFRRLDAGETLRDADLFEVKRFLFHATAVLHEADGLDDLPDRNSPMASLLVELMETIHPESLPSARFHLADELSERLTNRRSRLREVRRRLKKRRDQLEEAIAERHGGKFDLRGRFIPADGDEIDDRQLEREGGRYRVVDDELDRLRADVDAIRREVGEEEDRQRARLTDCVAERIDLVEEIHQRLVALDLGLTCAQLRRELSGCWPEVDLETRCVLQIEDGREPSLSENMPAEEVQPIDVALEEAVTVVLGPNMGGKSALLRLVGICQWCAQMAIPLPAGRCLFGEVRRIVYVGSEEPSDTKAAPGLSAFGREVRRFVHFWDEPGPILWLLDEPGRGTHPEEGARLAAAIAAARAARGDIVLMATHFPLLAADQSFATIRVAGLDVDGETLRAELGEADEDASGLQKVLRRFMDYRVVKADGHGVPRDARRVARALGLDLDLK